MALRAKRWLLALTLVGCARQNPAFGESTDGGDTGAATGAGQTDPTSGQGATGDPPGTGNATGSATGADTDKEGSSSGGPPPTGDTTADPDITTTSGGTGGCEIVILDAQSDTFISNAPLACEGGSCADWTFTGIGNYDIRSGGAFDSIMLIRFETAEPIADVSSATLHLHIMGPVSKDAGLVEIHVSETQSVWEDTGQNGPIEALPTWAEAASGVTPWTDGDGLPVPDFDELHNDWPTIPITEGDGDDDILELQIDGNDYDELEARLSVTTPVVIGVTVLSAVTTGAITAMTMDAGFGARLELEVCG